MQSYHGVTVDKQLKIFLGNNTYLNQHSHNKFKKFERVSEDFRFTLNHTLPPSLKLMFRTIVYILIRFLTMEFPTQPSRHFFYVGFFKKENS